MNEHACKKEADLKYMRKDIDKVTKKIETANSYLLVILVSVIGFLITDKLF